MGEPSNCDWRAKCILSDVKVLLGTRVLSKIVYGNRSLNKEAGSLAKWTRCKECFLF